MEKKEMIKSEIENYAKFDIIRYAQCWEDAEILLEALDINEKDNILSIASAGENTISMLIKNPNNIYAIDLNKNQIFCTELKIVSYKYLDYEECMELIGVFSSKRRIKLYNKIKEKLSKECKEYFNENIEYIQDGIINKGKFENYFQIFGNKILPLIHNKKRRKELLEPKTTEEREKFYKEKWNNLRWKMIFRIFFSRTIMGKLGRDKAFFKYVKVNVAEHILIRTKYAITQLDTSINPYLHYIINGKYEKVLPIAYRKENFEMIKKNIDKIKLYSEPIEQFIKRDEINYISKYNLSDIFEYMSEEQMEKLVLKMLEKSSPNAKMVYWNMLSEKIASKKIKKLEYKKELSEKLFKKDKAFFYSNFIIEEVKNNDN